MKAVVIERVDSFRISDCPEPAVGRDEVLVRVAACGLCGTDLHILKGEYPSRFPLIPGHEFAGTVVRVGSDVTDVRANDRVCVDPNVYCHACAYCRAGKGHLCENLHPIGVRRDGGFAEFCSVPRPQVYVLPDSVGFSEAAMAEPLSCALHGIDLAGIRPGQTVLILGGGAIGGLLAQLARVAGAARVVVSEPKASRRAMLLKGAADAVIDPASEPVARAIRRFDPHGADVVFEAAGLTVTAGQSLGAAKRGATIVFFGVVPPDQKIEVSPYEVYANEWTIRGSFINPHTIQAAVNLLAAGKVDVRPFISHQFPLAQFGRALEMFGGPESYKIQLLPT